MVRSSGVPEAKVPWVSRWMEAEASPRRPSLTTCLFRSKCSISPLDVTRWVRVRKGRGAEMGGRERERLSRGRRRTTGAPSSKRHTGVVPWCD